MVSCLRLWALCGTARPAIVFSKLRGNASLQKISPIIIRRKEEKYVSPGHLFHPVDSRSWAGQCLPISFSLLQCPKGLSL
uniref:Uncharacterized protein n=1 Tax=Utricularia reniformis TaxID=192314 RepID=A0A1Y0B379_9LAMI|nr:hypothetical protein AEK19_MT1715 [Utricularia reniformis]ART31895.1 hypothetical protein AEK19_MT1715 [Utricularia reniformis]